MKKIGKIWALTLLMTVAGAGISDMEAQTCCGGRPKMLYGDTTHVGVPFSKDPEVVNFGGRYLMYFSVPPHKGDKKGGWNIGIAESHDLTNWTKVGEITPAPDAPNEAKGFCAPGALVRDGVIHLFYQSYGNGKYDAVCHATSTDGINFRRDPTNPVFAPTGDWTCGRAIDADVVEYKGKYFLYFATRDKDFKIQQLGVATAPKGTDFSRSQWTQACSAPILKPELPWEGKCIEAPSAVIKNGKMYLFYAGSYNNDPQQIGVAVSKDGIHFKRLSDEPFLRNGCKGAWNESESGHPHLFEDKDGKTYLFYQGNKTHGKDWYISQRPVEWKKGRPVLK